MLENSLFILITMTGIYSAAALFGCLHILKWRGLQMGLLGDCFFWQQAIGSMMHIPFFIYLFPVYTKE